MAYFEALSRNLLGGAEELNETSEDVQCPGQDSNRARTEYKAIQGHRKPFNVTMVALPPEIC